VSDLIEALQILLKYGNPEYPTNCQHDVMMIHPDIDPGKVSHEDLTRLEELEFIVSNEDGERHFRSYHFGSA